MVAPEGKLVCAEMKSPVTDPSVLMSAEAMSCCLKFL